MKKSFKSILSVLISAVLVVSLAGMLFTSFADTISDKQKELDEINKKISEMQTEKTKYDKSATKLTKEIAELDEKIHDAEGEIKILNAEINVTKAKISEKLEELEQKESEINIQNDELNTRLRAMYKYGNCGFLSVILKSTSITNLLTNIEMSRRIYASDSDLLEGLHTEYDVIYQAKKELTDLKDELLGKQAVLKEKKADLTSQKNDLESKKKAANSSSQELKAQLNTIKNQADDLVNEIRRLQGGGAYAGGGMSWPTKSSTRVTSPFGRRYIFGSYSNHTGIDIGAAKNTNILASNDGTVIKVAYAPNGYGNYCMIDHGGGVVTLYAHQTEVLVSVGQVVTRGQTIGKVGSTGLSTGPHIHFEIRINGKYQDPLDTTKTYYVVPGVYY